MLTQINKLDEQVSNQGSAWPAGLVIVTPMGDYGEDPMLGFVSVDNKIINPVSTQETHKQGIGGCLTQ